MALLAGFIRVNEGIIAGADSSGSKAETNIVRLGNSAVGLAIDDYVSGAALCLEALKAKGETTLDAIIEETTKILQNPSSRFKGKTITVLFVGYEKDGSEKPAFILRFDGTKIITSQTWPYDAAFSYDDSLARSITNKVHSRSMTVNETKVLMAYVLLQYSQISQTGRKITMATLTDSGFSFIDTGETEKVISEAQRIDSAIKRLGYDLFIRRGSA